MVATTRSPGGLTNAGADVQDIFIERVKAGNPSRYLTPTGWQPFEIRSETIAVAGGEPRVIEVRETRHGPVLPDELPVPADAPMVFSKILRELYVPALRWTGLARDDRTLDALLGFAEARSTEELIEGLHPIVSPMQAIVVADRAGEVALTTPARVPVRRAGNVVEGRAPVPGWLDTYDWQRVVPASKIPTVRAPEDGALVTANTRLPNADAPMMTRDWDETARLDRATALVADAKAPHDVASMIAVQNDTKSEPMLVLRDRLLALHAPEEPYRAILTEWNGRMDRDETAPTLMVGWARFVQAQALADDLGAAFLRFDDIDHHALQSVLAGGARDWCDDQTTSRTETCEEIAAEAWDAALADLRSRYGDDPEGWRWGRVHPARHTHQPFSKVPVLRDLFTVERPAGGGVAHVESW